MLIPEDQQTWAPNESVSPPPVWMQLRADELTEQALALAAAEEADEAREDYFTNAHHAQPWLVSAGANSPRMRADPPLYSPPDVNSPRMRDDPPPYFPPDANSPPHIIANHQPQPVRRRPLPTHAHIPREFIPNRVYTAPTHSNTRPRLQRALTTHQFSDFLGKELGDEREDMRDRRASLHPFEHVVKVMCRKAKKVVEEGVKAAKR
jgi:hypothetical protein